MIELPNVNTWHVCIMIAAVVTAFATSWHDIFWQMDSSIKAGVASVAFAGAALLYGLNVITSLAFATGAKHQRLLGLRARFAFTDVPGHAGQMDQRESSKADHGPADKQLPTQRSAPEMRELRKFAQRFREERARQSRLHAERCRRERQQRPRPKSPEPEAEAKPIPETSQYPERKRSKEKRSRRPQPSLARVSAHSSQPRRNHQLPSLRSAPEMRGLKLWRASDGQGQPQESAHTPLRRLGLSTRASWAIPYDEIELDQIVGMGSWGRVYAGRFHGSRVAIKELMGSNKVHESPGMSGRATKEALRAFRAESDILMGLHHSAVIELFGICESPSGMLYIVTEFCELDLTTLIANGNAHGRYLGMHDAVLWRDLACQLCSGMRYLHSKNIMHRDLKPDNVVLVPLAPGRGGKQRLQAKICDFGISKRIAPDAHGDMMQHTRAVGTPLYMAPEVLKGERRKAVYSFESDVYSFGIMLWMLWCGKVPFDDLEGSLLDFMAAVMRGRRPSFDEDDRWPSGVVAFVQRLWANDPQVRPTFAQMQQTGMMSFDTLFCGTATPSEAEDEDEDEAEGEDEGEDKSEDEGEDDGEDEGEVGDGDGDGDGDADDECENGVVIKAGVGFCGGRVNRTTQLKALPKLSVTQMQCSGDMRSMQPTPSTGLSASSSVQLSAASSVLASDSDPDVASHIVDQYVDGDAPQVQSDLSDEEPETRLRGFTDVVDETVCETFA